MFVVVVFILDNWYRALLEQQTVEFKQYFKFNRTNELFFHREQEMSIFYGDGIWICFNVHCDGQILDIFRIVLILHVHDDTTTD